MVPREEQGFPTRRLLYSQGYRATAEPARPDAGLDPTRIHRYDALADRAVSARVR
jgi:hypothetical protein